MDNHTIAICNDNLINMVLLKPAQPSDFNAFGKLWDYSSQLTQLQLQ